MANTITFANDMIILESLDSDWVWTTTCTAQKWASGLYVQSIQFIPGATGDRCRFENTAVGGDEIFDSGPCADAYDTKIKYFGGKLMRPALDYSDGTYSSGSKIIIDLVRV